MVPSAELDDPGAGSDALTLHLGWDGEILGADEVRGRLLPPRNLSGWLRERRDRLARETVKRLLGRDLVAVLEKKLADHVGIDANGAVSAWLQPRRWLSADEIGLR